MKTAVLVLFVISAFSAALASCKTPGEYLTYNDLPYTYTAPIKPSGYTGSEIANQVDDYYTYWAATYLKVGTDTSWYYVAGEANGDTPDSWNGVAAKATSEGHGYGMIITALMNRQTEFDGLYNMYSAFPSTGNPNLMSWIIPENEDTSLLSDSASDGDIDIAYSLLLADKKWGSTGSIDYKAEALRIIDAIMESEISHSTWRVLLGDWDSDNLSTRPSDWIPDHFRAFKDASEDTRWDKVITALYDERMDIFNTYAASTGLMPDFVVNDPPEPAPPDFLEGQHDGDYYYNACRVPWRIACDYVLYGSPETGKKAKITVKTMEDWIVKETSGNPDAVKAGYTLKGKALADYSEGCFTAPFVAGAAADPSFQSFLDNGWDKIRAGKSNYFNDTITMLVLLLVSGIWQAP